MSVAACFAGPLFNMLVGLGVSLTAKCAASYPHPFEFQLTLKHNITFAFLILSLISSLIIVPLCNFQVKKGYGIYLLCLNAVFSGVIIAIEISNYTFIIPPLSELL
jgi:sodium/potassium/calcium exchanger 6